MTEKENIQKLLDTQSFVLDDSQTVSEAIDCGGLSLAGIVIPAGLTGTAFTFQVSIDGTTYQQLYYDDAAVTEVVAASKSVSLKSPTAFWPWRYVKVVSGSSQSGAITMTAVLRSIAP